MTTKPEAAFWKWLSAATFGLWNVQRHEDKHSVGIPDLSYGAEGINGWVELKAYGKWPNGPCPHFTAKQENWLVSRGKAGGHCFVLIRVKSTILLFNWTSAPVLRSKKCNEKIMKEQAIAVWTNEFNRTEFIGLLTRR